MRKRNKRIFHSSRKVTKLPKILTQERDFYEIDKFVRDLKRDAVSVADHMGKDMIVSINHEREMYSVLSALEGWNDCFNDLALAQNDESYDDYPMRLMMALLKDEKMLSMTLIRDVEKVVEHQRKLYMKAPAGIINKVANELLEKQD